MLILTLALAVTAGTQQPLPFSHKTHVSVGLKCKECHPNPDPGQKMTFPATSKCMACHIAVAKDKPAIQKLAEYAKKEEPIPWARVYSVAAGVYWDHRAHLNARTKCNQCHGEVEKMEIVLKVGNITSMEGCVNCHNERDVSTGCEFCHEGK